MALLRCRSSGEAAGPTGDGDEGAEPDQLPVQTLSARSHSGKMAKASRQKVRGEAPTEIHAGARCADMDWVSMSQRCYVLTSRTHFCILTVKANLSWHTAERVQRCWTFSAALCRCRYFSGGSP